MIKIQVLKLITRPEKWRQTIINPGVSFVIQILARNCNEIVYLSLLVILHISLNLMKRYTWLLNAPTHLRQ